MKIISAKDYDSMSRKAANLIASQVIMKPDCVLGLATGSSPLGIYGELVKMYKNGDLDFTNVRTANLDEYCGLTRDNDQSYYYFMHHNLFQHINIKEENTNIPDGTNPNAEAECRRYDETVRTLGGVDLQLLGIGHNGHIGFNEPCDEFVAATHCVELTEKTIEANTRFFKSRDEVPRKAYTMGIKTIMSAKKIVLIASGKEKAEIICEMATGKITPQVPASILQLHPDATIFCDEAALSVLAEKQPQMICQF